MTDRKYINPYREFLGEYFDQDVLAERDRVALYDMTDGENCRCDDAPCTCDDPIETKDGG